MGAGNARVPRALMNDTSCSRRTARYAVAEARHLSYYDNLTWSLSLSQPRRCEPRTLQLQPRPSLPFPSQHTRVPRYRYPILFHGEISEKS
jgi:hypothetical protein